MDDKIKSKNSRKLIIGLAIVSSIVAFITLISIIFDFKWFYYYVDTTYCRGILFPLRAVYLVLSALTVGFYAILYGHQINKQYQTSIIAVPFVPVLFGVLQSLTTGISFEYVGMLFSILILFIGVQNRDMNRDGLTGLLNKKR
jgi:hypothetical protein